MATTLPYMVAGIDPNIDLAELSTSQLTMRYNLYRNHRRLADERSRRYPASFFYKRDWDEANENMKVIAAELRNRGIDPEN